MKSYKNIEGLIFTTDNYTELYVLDNVVRYNTEDWDTEYKEDMMTNHGVLDDDGVDLFNEDVETIDLDTALEYNLLEEV